MIKSSPIGYFVQLPDEPAPRGPFRSRDRAERMLSNATARPTGTLRPQVEKPEPPPLRVVKPAGEGESRHERRRQSAKNKRTRRKMLKVVKKAIVSPDHEATAAADEPSKLDELARGADGHHTEDMEIPR